MRRLRSTHMHAPPATCALHWYRANIAPACLPACLPRQLLHRRQTWAQTASPYAHTASCLNPCWSMHNQCCARLSNHTAQVVNLDAVRNYLAKHPDQAVQSVSQGSTDAALHQAVVASGEVRACCPVSGAIKRLVSGRCWLPGCAWCLAGRVRSRPQQLDAAPCCARASYTRAVCVCHHAAHLHTPVACLPLPLPLLIHRSPTYARATLPPSWASAHWTRCGEHAVHAGRAGTLCSTAAVHADVCPGSPCSMRIGRTAAVWPPAALR